MEKDNLTIATKHRSKYKQLADEERNLLDRRQAIEQIIGHLKVEHRKCC